MDPGTKVLIFFSGGAAVLAGGWWLLRKLFGIPDIDPTAPKAKDTWWQSRDEPADPPDRR